MSDEFGWLDVEEIGELLAEHYPKRDPYAVRFTELTGMVEKLPGFKTDPEHPVNEKILETIQAAWIEEREPVRQVVAWAGRARASGSGRTPPRRYPSDARQHRARGDPRRVIRRVARNPPRERSTRTTHG